MAQLELLNYYRFFEIETPAATADVWRSLAAQLGLTGTLILAREGTNSALVGPPEKIDQYIARKSDFDWDQASVKRLPVDEYESPYAKLKVKIKAEICTAGFAAPHELNRGRFIPPAAFQRLAAAPDTVLLDVRNNYEARIGTFRGARTIDMEHFREFPARLEEIADLRGKRVIGFCTGGIRCEKAIPFLRENGFDAYELEGGILNYLKEFPDGLWEGECFVFDDRYALTGDLRTGSYRPCPRCGQPARDGRCVVCGVVGPV